MQTAERPGIPPRALAAQGGDEPSLQSMELGAVPGERRACCLLQRKSSSPAHSPGTSCMRPDVRLIHQGEIQSVPR